MSTASALCDKGAAPSPPPPTHEEQTMKKSTLSALLVIASSAAASNALAQDVAAGKTSFNKCMACHSIGDGAKNKVGPSLNGLDGRKSGTVEGYNYSDANKNSGITWNEAQFKEYIKDPKAKVPGTKMAFAGIKNENEIRQSLGVRLAIRQGRQDQGAVARSRLAGDHRFAGTRHAPASASLMSMPKASCGGAVISTSCAALSPARPPAGRQ